MDAEEEVSSIVRDLGISLSPSSPSPPPQYPPSTSTRSPIESLASSDPSPSSIPPRIALHCTERDYTMIITNSKDRPKLLFDTVCTLTDIKYVVFHRTVSTSIEGAYQEYYIRHINGHPLSYDAKTQYVIQCLEAAIELRTLELW